MTQDIDLARTATETGKVTTAVLKEVTSLHRRAMELAEQAFIAKGTQETKRASLLTEEAYGFELLAANIISNYSLEPTRSVLHRSAATLAVDCGNLPDAVRLVRRALRGNPPAEILQELEEILKNIPSSIRLAITQEDSSAFEKASSIDLEQLRGRIETRTAKVGIIGLGYVGLPLALLFSEREFPVTGFDIDSEKVKALNSGKSYIYRISETEISAARGRNFSATTDYSQASEMDVIIVCVPTPLDEYREPDLSYIQATAKAIAPHLKAGQLIILESTTYPGTTEEVLVPILEARNSLALTAARDIGEPGKVFFVAFSPQREDPGNDTIARRDIPKVVGGLNPVSSELAGALYHSIFDRIVPVSSPTVAEMTKLLENIYRCINIALVNELKMLCLRMGINIWEVIQAASTKPFGFHPFYPGPGLGGHSIAVDPFYLAWKAKEFDFQPKFIELAGEINTFMPYHVVNSVTAALNTQRKALNGSKVLVLGLAYKRDIDDLRESPALTIIEELQRRGAQVFYNDPYFPTVGRGRRYNLHMTSTPLENLNQYDCVLIVTDHSDYDYQRIVRESQMVVDTRNATHGINSDKIVRC